MGETLFCTAGSSCEELSLQLPMSENFDLFSKFTEYNCMRYLLAFYLDYIGRKYLRENIYPLFKFLKEPIVQNSPIKF
jgi:hypothetical protein